jgi:hypothetical protein
MTDELTSIASITWQELPQAMPPSMSDSSLVLSLDEFFVLLPIKSRDPRLTGTLELDWLRFGSISKTCISRIVVVSSKK